MVWGDYVKLVDSGRVIFMWLLLYTYQLHAALTCFMKWWDMSIFIIS